MLAAPVGDLAVHLDDLTEALGVRTSADSPITRACFELYVRWLSARLHRRSLPAVRLTDGRREWIAGDGIPRASVRADRYDLFRMISGRRRAAWIASLPWDGDPTAVMTSSRPIPWPSQLLTCASARN